MTTYSKKKKDIYAHRRRKSAAKHLERLTKIVQESNNKDVTRLMDRVNNLWWNMQEKLGWYEGVPKRGERSETPAQRIKESLIRNVVPIPRYICPSCHKPGFLFSPNMDLKGRDFERFIFHIEWPSMKTEFCQIATSKTNLIWIEAEPTEGVYVMRQ